MDQPLALQRIAALLESCPLPVSSEANLHQAIAQALRGESIEFSREVTLSDKDRIDFMCGSIGIEAKIGGSYVAVASQVLRYLESDMVSGLIIVTNKASHRQLHGLVSEQGKPVHCCFIGFYGI